MKFKRQLSIIFNAVMLKSLFGWTHKSGSNGKKYFGEGKPWSRKGKHQWKMFQKEEKIFLLMDSKEIVVFYYVTTFKPLFTGYI